MKTIGIICEYNPFHNGHLYHIKKIKEQFPDSLLICVMSGNYVERGEVSFINKWEKTKLALDHQIDLVVELPFAFASQSADLFCKGSIQILNALQVDAIVFGSESNDVDILKQLVKIQKTEDYQKRVKEEIEKGNNYPTAMANALKKEINITLGPNDTLALGYLRELDHQHSSILPYSIKRTNDYHSLDTSKSIISATAIRNLAKNGQDISPFVPYSLASFTFHFNQDYFEKLKYKIISETDLTRYQSVEEGIEHRIQKAALEANDYEELVHKIKTKRYTYHKISRMLIHILVGFTKQEANRMKNISYIRILGFNSSGQQYLKQIKKKCTIPILSKFENHPMLALEQRASLIYDGSLEYQMKPIKKEN